MDEADRKKFDRSVEDRLTDLAADLLKLRIEVHKSSGGYDVDVKDLRASAKTAGKEITDLKARVKDLESKIAKMKK